MCLAIPGKILKFIESEPAKGQIGYNAKVDFGGVVKIVNMSLVPDATVGDYVITHVGVAISQVDEDEAKKSLEYWKDFEAERE